MPIAEVLDLRGFNLNDKLDIDPEFLDAGGSMTTTMAMTSDGHDHEHDENCDHARTTTPTTTTSSPSSSRPTSR